jgi:hypothetical protein
MRMSAMGLLAEAQRRQGDKIPAAEGDAVRGSELCAVVETDRQGTGGRGTPFTPLHTLVSKGDHVMHGTTDIGEVESVSLTVLVDNKADLIVESSDRVRYFTDGPLLAEHGFSVLI